MTVGELRQMLIGVPDDIKVICFARDGEGFEPDNEQSGEISFQTYDMEGNEIEPPHDIPNIFGLLHEDCQEEPEYDVTLN